MRCYAAVRTQQTRTPPNVNVTTSRKTDAKRSVVSRGSSDLTTQSKPSESTSTRSSRRHTAFRLLPPKKKHSWQIRCVQIQHGHITPSGLSQELFVRAFHSVPNCVETWRLWIFIAPKKKFSSPFSCGDRQLDTTAYSIST